METYLDTTKTPQQRAQDLLSRLSLDEKMAQINCLFPYDWSEASKEFCQRESRYGIGQVSTLQVRELKTLEEAAAWQKHYQTMVMEHSPHHIPAIFHMEGLCGPFLQGGISLPAGINRGSAFDPELEEKLAAVVARQELACGFTQVLAPVLDISRDSRMGRQCESYGEDPTLAAALGTAFTRGIQNHSAAGRQAESCAKHFAGFHNSLGGIHGAECNTPIPMFKEIYAKPFQAAITNAKLRGIMPCYCTINGVPASSDHWLLTELLREEMGFDGTCLSDYYAVANVHNVQHVGETMEEVGLLCLEAGMDVEMQNRVAYNDGLKAMFESGQADMAILDRAVLRVLEAKFRMGLFEHPFALEGEELQKCFFGGCLEEATGEPQDQEAGNHQVAEPGTGKEEGTSDYALTLQAARESLILLKNDGVLPMKNSIKKIAVIGKHAGYARSFFGGYTHLSMMEATLADANSIAGLESGSLDNDKVERVPGTKVQSDETPEFDALLRHQKPGCKNLVEELRDRLPEVEVVYAYGYPVAGTDVSHLPEALEAAQDADLILMTLGGKNGSCSVATMGEGVDGTDINLPKCQDAAITELAKLGIPMVGIHLDGRPISSDIADEKLDAIIEAWSPAEAGAQAIVDVLTGDYNPGGKLPVSVARSSGQIGVHYNHYNGSAWHQGDSIGFANYVDMSHTPRYYFGYGLSYTSFSYQDIRLECTKQQVGDADAAGTAKTGTTGDGTTLQISPEGAFSVSFTLTNTGAVAGDEVVQLYVTDEYASVNRPVKELAGFVRVHLDAGESRQVTFTMQVSQTAFVDRQGKWKVEKGGFIIEIGSASNDIRLTEHVTITEDAYIDPKDRGFYAATEVR